MDRSNAKLIPAVEQVKVIWRHNWGKSTNAFAQTAADIGVTETTIRRYINGDSIPRSNAVIDNIRARYEQIVREEYAEGE